MNPAPELGKEMLVGHTGSPFWNGRKAFPADKIDDLTADKKLEIYTEMETDEDCESALFIVKLLALSAGYRLIPKDLGDELSLRITELCSYALGSLDEPFEEILDDLLDALHLGYTVAEIAWEKRSWDGAEMIVPWAIKSKPHQNVQLVFDDFMNLIGVVGRRKGDPVYVNRHSLAVRDEDIIPPEHTLIFRFRPSSRFPLGRSLLRGAYNSWRAKTETLRLMFQYQDRFSNPSIIGMLPEHAQMEVQKQDDQGNLLKDAVGAPLMEPATEAFSRQLTKFRSGSVIAIQSGAKVEALEVDAAADVFLDALRYYGRQIKTAIIKIARLLQEAEHGSKADSALAHKIVLQYIRNIRKQIEAAIERHLLRKIVEVNYGKDVALSHCPEIRLSADSVDEDLEIVGKIIADLFRAGYFHDSQLAALDDRLGMPERDIEAQRLEQEEERDIARLQRLELSKLTQPEQDADRGQDAEAV